MNELQREARPKLFSYAVAALSNFLGLPSESQGLSPLGGAVGPLVVCGSTRVALGSPSGDRMHSELGPGSYKVIGPAHVPVSPSQGVGQIPGHRLAQGAGGLQGPSALGIAASDQVGRSGCRPWL